MAATKQDILTCLFTPMSWLWGAATAVRNKLFDLKVLPQTTFDIPIVSVGNLTVGGTGKTPHVEYIVEKLMSRYKIAVLSRGYKRKTKGFVLANFHSTPFDIGDEAYQTFHKFGAKVKVAVCERRVQGIKELTRLYPDLDMIILDDGYQHRYVKPKVNILLSDYHRPYYDDKVLPLGRLREAGTGVVRADIVVVTKCPADLAPIQKRIIAKHMNLMAYQKLFFTAYDIEEPQPAFPEQCSYRVNLEDLDKYDSALVITGIANPRSFIRYFKNFEFKIRISHFPDHHAYDRTDIKKIQSQFKALRGRHKIILTTEKDAVRLVNSPYFPEELKPLVFYLPLNVKMLESIQGDDLVETISTLMSRTSKH